jgi:Endoplasmic reticulum vesicle transporter
MLFPLKFIFDLSPIAVSYSTRSRHWYDYMTSIFAIIGGTFTAIGILESSIAKALSARKKR